MKLINDPAVYIVGRQVVIEEEIDRFLSDSGIESWETDTDVAGQKLVEVGGRLCYMSFSKPRPGGNAAYIDHILEVGHGSVTEHATWNFIVTGISRALSHELVRHRVGVSPSQLSQRYVDESSAEYVVPPDLADEIRLAAAMSKKSNETLTELYKDPKYANLTDAERGEMITIGLDWLDSVKSSHDTYCNLSDYLAVKAAKNYPDMSKTDARKFARQAARSVLPNATETKIFLTFNARALRHFIELRASRFAEPEIRKLAVMFLNLMQTEAPNLFRDFKLIELADGTFEATTEHCKV